MRESGEQDVIELRRLFGDRGDDGRMAVAVEIHPPRGDAVNQLAAVIGVQIDALGLGDTNRRRVERLLRERMPDLKMWVHA